MTDEFTIDYHTKWLQDCRSLDDEAWFHLALFAIIRCGLSFYRSFLCFILFLLFLFGELFNRLYLDQVATVSHCVFNQRGRKQLSHYASVRLSMRLCERYWLPVGLGCHFSFVLFLYILFYLSFWLKLICHSLRSFTSFIHSVRTAVRSLRSLSACQINLVIIRAGELVHHSYYLYLPG